MFPQLPIPTSLARRQFLRRTGVCLATAALASLLAAESTGEPATQPARKRLPGLAGLPHFPPRAKRVIYLFQSGAPSQMDLFDYKPALAERHGEDLPESIRMGQRLTAMTSGQKTSRRPVDLQVRATRPERGLGQRTVAAHGEDRRRLCFLKSMHTEAINHDPAITFFQTGCQLAGAAEHGLVGRLRPGQRERRPAGVRRDDLAAAEPDRPAALRPAVGQRLPADAATRGSSSAAAGDPVLYLTNPPGVVDADPPADARRPRRAQPACSTSEIRRSRRSPRASRSTSWPSACRRRCPS